MPKPDDLLASSDAARILECSADNVRRLAKAGVLVPAFTTANPTRPVALYRRADVEALRAKRARPQRTPIPTERRARR
jgi:DNA-binding transcriptional MerR regulator